jgi:hypothetical protein
MKRNVRLHMLLSEEERAMLGALASAERTTPSEWVRSAIRANFKQLRPATAWSKWLDERLRIGT